MKKLPPMMMITVLLLGLTTATALAQYNLDNNLEQRSGSVNPQATNVDYGSRNDIIYGNINAGKGFRGNLDYGAPGDFRGNTGSDELYRFRADATRSISGRELTKPQSVQRASHSALLGSVRSNNPINRSAIPSSGLPIDAYRTGQATTTGQLIQTPRIGASRAGTIGTQGDLSGRSLGVGATSWQGMGVPLDTPIGAVNLRPVGAGGQTNQINRTLYGALTTPQALGGTLGANSANTIGTASNSLWQTDPRQNLAYPNSTAPTLEQIIAPTQTSLNTELAPQPAYQSGLGMEQKVARLQAQQVKLEASLLSNVGEDTFMKLQRNQTNRKRVAQGLEPIQDGVNPNNQLVSNPAQIKSLPSNQSLFNNLMGSEINDSETGADTNRHAHLRTGSHTVTGILPHGIPGSGLPGARLPGSGLPGGGKSNHPLASSVSTPIAPQEQIQAQKKLHDAMLESRGVTDNHNILEQIVGTPVPSINPQPTPSEHLTGGLFAPDPTSKSINTTPKTALNNNYLLKNKTTQTGLSVPGIQLPQTIAIQQREWHLTRSMAQATLALKAGRYLDAERQFKSVLLGNPDQYEASAGLLCAQLGAGMVRSTALNLRQHMTKFPEQMAYKLDRAYLPSGRRLDWVRQQAQNLMQQYGNYDAALLLAFLGYQTSDKHLLQYGLSLAQKHMAADPLVVDLSRAWLGQK